MTPARTGAISRTTESTPPEQAPPAELLPPAEPSSSADPVPLIDPVPPTEPKAIVVPPVPSQTDTSAPGPSKPKEPTPVAPAISSELAPAPPETALDETGPTTSAPINRPESPTRTEAWAKLVADPGHAPELLALAAVQSIGPRAQDWLDRTKRDYPTADPTALARLATSQFTRAGGLGSIFGAVAGSYTPVALLGTAAVAHAELILHLAAAYGLDPQDPERAVDLLVLTHVHPDRVDAESALAAAQRPAYDEQSGLTAAVWRLSRMITTRVGGWGVIRLINRYLPGVSLLTAFLTSRAAAETVAARANAHYRRQTN